MIRLIRAEWVAAPGFMALGTTALITALGLGAMGCDPGGVGDPCIPEDEYRQQVPGYAVTEVNVESRSFQCETRVCLVNHFRGRVSCPYGQDTDTVAACTMGNANCTSDTGKGCRVPGTDGTDPNDRIRVPVSPQFLHRDASDAVYCSCRCDGPDENARYCECPSGFSCVELVENLAIGAGQLAGSYCIKEGTRYDTSQSTGVECQQQVDDVGNITGGNCGNDGKNP